MRDPEPVDPSAPSPDDTVRLSAGAPADPYATQRLNLSNDLGIDASQKLPAGKSMAASDQTLKMTRPKMGEPPLRVQRVDQPTGAEGQTQDQPLRPAAPAPFGWRWSLGLGALVVLGAAGFLVFSKGPVPPPTRPTAGPDVGARETTGTAGALPPDVQAYLEQAKAGDTHAMRMLGAMYLQGLNVPKDREKGLYWYRKAAEMGSDAARSELNQIEGGR
ncbi:MAG: SEL1-like repeat protein [Geothrix sp.]|uniref:tetratricopeptide repeat protein n=1 Tax=Geothrix sp. TaxID=1962974 RepID=UPI0017BBEE0D|nr:SEL1-like repeat protein [Geothrix sp.]NWJ40143.1 SEL1-like repeat protein [Geothrix sp.]WIL21848.1 MAG: SEL1-like repeat protein [Geothrix sp.]